MPLQRDIKHLPPGDSVDAAMAKGWTAVDPNMDQQTQSQHKTEHARSRHRMHDSGRRYSTDEKRQQSTKPPVHGQALSKASTTRFDSIPRRDIEELKIGKKRLSIDLSNSQTGEQSRQSSGDNTGTRNTNHAEHRVQSQDDHVPLSTFDDTSNLNYSLEDIHGTDDKTAILKPTSQEQKHVPSADATQPALAGVDPRILQTLADSERGMRGIPLQHTVTQSHGYTRLRLRNSREFRLESRMIEPPETPSRGPTHTEPSTLYSVQMSPKHRPDKQVNFSIPPQTSSFEAESETVSELQDDLGLSQTQPTFRISMPVHSTPATTADSYSTLRRPLSRNDLSEPRGSAHRFTQSTNSNLVNGQHPRKSSVKLAEHGQKHVDGQPYADDESPVLSDNSGSRKRTRDIGLDYEPEALLTKTLSDLQNEPFLYDPAELHDSVPGGANHIHALDQQLSGLHELSEAKRKALFMTQNDDDWEQTGQWFVDRFQASVKQIQQIRLERRHLSLNFEDEIRRRHAAVRHAEDVVNKELKELHQGGGALLKGREPMSRSGTPVKAAGGL